MFKKIIFTLTLFFVASVQAYDLGDIDEIRNFFFTADLLYWKAHQDGLGYTTRPSNTQTTDDFTKKGLIQPNFHWDYGFRFGMGFDPDDQWHLDIFWTHLDSIATGETAYESTYSPFKGTFPVWSMSNDILKGDFVSRSEMRWKLRMNIVDIDLQREFYCWRCIVFIPQIGLRIPMLEQKMNVNYHGGSFYNGTDYNSMHNDFTGVGPRVSLFSNFALGDGFSLFARVAGSAIYGRFETDHHERLYDFERLHQSNKSYRVLWSCDYFAGLQWQTTFFCNLYQITFRTGWEQLWFFNENRFKRGHFGFFKKHRNLSFQGWTFNASLNF